MTTATVVVNGREYHVSARKADLVRRLINTDVDAIKVGRVQLLINGNGCQLEVAERYTFEEWTDAR